MIRILTKQQRRPKRVIRMRMKIHGTAAIPRLSFHRTNTALYAQLIDDDKHRTLYTAKNKGTNKLIAKKLSQTIIDYAKKHAVKQLLFDRSGNKYHGVVQEFADTIRQGGIRI